MISPSPLGENYLACCKIARWFDRYHAATNIVTKCSKTTTVPRSDPHTPCIAINREVYLLSSRDNEPESGILPEGKYGSNDSERSEHQWTSTHVENRKSPQDSSNG